MVSPADYSVTIKVNDVDVTAFVPFDSIRFDDHATEVSYLSFKIEKPSGVTPARQHSVVLIADDLTNTPTMFSGYITELREKKRDNGITLEYEVECADQKIRLQKSVLDVESLTGIDSSILSGLLTNAYPDLTSLFNFSNGVTAFTDSITLPTGNKNILDALKDLSDLAGGADFRFENVAVASETITFNSAEDTIGQAPPASTPPYWQATASLSTPTVQATGGNPDYCLQLNPTSGSWTSSLPYNVFIALTDTMGESNTINNIVFDYYVSSDIVGSATIEVIITDDTGSNDSHTFSSLTGGAWTTIDVGNDGGGSLFPVDIGNAFGDNDVTIQFKNNATIDTAANDFDVRYDNIEFDVDTALGASGLETRLIWGDTPDATDFDIDVDSGDEFAFDIDLELGDFDDFNSVTVIGGYEEESVTWTYHASGYQDHFDLELPIEITTLETNTNTDASPTWSAATVGVYGDDDLSSYDALYDDVNHWLYFASAPSELGQSFRITGNIRRPIRVRVEDVPDGEATLATTIYNDSISSQDQAVAIGETALAKRQQVRRMSFKTHEPGLKVGQSINISDTNRGLNEDIKIQRIVTRWLSGKLAEFTVYCGEDEGTSADILIADNDKRSRDNAQQIVSGTKSVVFLTDDSGVYLTDESGRKLYYEV